MIRPDFVAAERHAENPLVLRTAERITSGLEWWLSEEIASSSHGNNAFLDEYDSFVHNITNIGDPTLPAVDAKWNSHYDRLIEFTDAFKEHPDNTALFARQLFCIMMNISGAFRTQAHLGAITQEDYLERRRNDSPIGIDLLDAVTRRVWWHRFIKQGGQEQNQSDLEELIETTLTTNDLSREWMDFLIARGASDLRKQPTETIAMAQVAQELWVNLAADYTLFWNKRYNDAPWDLSRVPILEPKSITQGPEIIYPFAAK